MAYGKVIINDERRSFADLRLFDDSTSRDLMTDKNKIKKELERRYEGEEIEIVFDK